MSLKGHADNLRMTDFLAQTGELIERLNTDGFAGALDTALRAVAQFDLTAVISFPMGGKPRLLHDGMNGISTPHAMQTYLNGTYVLDACYVACCKGLTDGLYRLSDVAPDEFFETEYYNSPHVHPCISLSSGSLAEEVFYLSQPRPGVFHCYSLMRSSGRAKFYDSEIGKLKSLSPIVNALLAKHYASMAPQPAAGTPPDVLDAAFLTFKAGILSPREQHIVSLVLRGHSSVSVAEVLGIAEGTVKNHRKHIHAKLGVSSQAELFNQFLAHILAT
jgi:DNA-binding CsgD family transcriptional regulator